MCHSVVWKLCKINNLGALCAAVFSLSTKNLSGGGDNRPSLSDPVDLGSFFWPRHMPGFLNVSYSHSPIIKSVFFIIFRSEAAGKHSQVRSRRAVVHKHASDSVWVVVVAVLGIVIWSYDPKLFAYNHYRRTGAATALLRYVVGSSGATRISFRGVGGGVRALGAGP